MYIADLLSRHAVTSVHQLSLCMQVGEVDDVTCVRWNSSFNCGRGGWQAEGCQLMKGTANFEIICVCMNKGTFGLLDVSHG